MIDTEEVGSASSNGDRRVAFLSGVARSGTTAAVNLLNKHPEIAMGIERFKFTFLRDENPDKNLFDRDRFFAISDDETNLTHEMFNYQYDTLGEKYDSALVVGDKIPNLARCYRQIIGLFPNCRIIHIVREPSAVANSWARRAQNAVDDWVATADSAEGVHRWLHENTQAIHVREEFPSNILLVSYEGLFSDDPRTLELILEFLGVGPAVPHQHELRLNGAKLTANKRFFDVGAKPNNVADDRWSEVFALIPHLQAHVLPKASRS